MAVQSVLDVGVFISDDPKHPSPNGRKVRIHAPGVGTIWVRRDDDALDEATAWLARVYTRPATSLNVYELAESVAARSDRSVDDMPAGPVD